MLPFFLPTKTVNMLKNKFIKLIFLATIICLAACNSGKKYELKLRLNDGDQFTQNMLTDMNMDMEMMGQTMKMNMKNETECLFQVIKNNDGDKQLTYLYKNGYVHQNGWKCRSVAGCNGFYYEKTIGDDRGEIYADHTR